VIPAGIIPCQSDEATCFYTARVTTGQPPAPDRMSALGLQADVDRAVGDGPLLTHSGHSGFLALPMSALAGVRLLWFDSGNRISAMPSPLDHRQCSIRWAVSMIPDTEIWRAAMAVVKRYGDDAVLEDAARSLVRSAKRS